MINNHNKLTIEDNPTATSLGRLINTELQQKYRWATRDELTEQCETVLRSIERRFGTCFSRELIRRVAEIQFERFLTSKDETTLYNASELH